VYRHKEPPGLPIVKIAGTEAIQSPDSPLTRRDAFPLVRLRPLHGYSLEHFLEMLSGVVDWADSVS